MLSAPPLCLLIKLLPITDFIYPHIVLGIRGEFSIAQNNLNQQIFSTPKIDIHPAVFGLLAIIREA
jgi:hypothetical protein